jgi:hypothetical protein
MLPVIEWDEEMLKAANIDRAQAAALSKRLAEITEKRQAEESYAVFLEIQRMSALWAPYIVPILKQLRKKGVEVDALHNLLEQSILDQESTEHRELLAQKFSEQRAIITEAISEVVDLKVLERQMSALRRAGETNKCNR